MNRTIFQRLVAIIFVALILFINVPTVFKEVVMVLLSIGLFLSTFTGVKRDRV